jgi:regulator of extracellular matrix RemA (YlzA/DUF370 family)
VREIQTVKPENCPLKDVKKNCTLKNSLVILTLIRNVLLVIG